MRPRLLLHTCCVLCSCHVLEKLKTEFDLTAYFYNPNIEPREEYEKRRDTVKELCVKADIPFVEGEYDNAGWREVVKGYENELEGGARCTVCFAFRLWQTAKLAKEKGFDFFATTLTMGRNKRAELINPLAQKIASEWGVKFYPADWKKGGGQEAARQIAQKDDLYRQNYCGCGHSMRQISKSQIPIPNQSD